MSVRLMTAAWSVDLPASQKIVLLALADCANDEGRCWPGMASLARKCSKSERTVQAMIAALEADGQLSRSQVPGKGCFYFVHPRNSRTPEEAAPPQKTAETPAKSAPKPSGTVIGLANAKPPRERKSLHPIPANWEPVLTPACQRVVDGWPPGMFDRQLAMFRDHAADKGRLSKDWQAAFRTWIGKADEWKPNDRNNRPDKSTRTAAQLALQRLHHG